MDDYTDLLNFYIQKTSLGEKIYSAIRPITLVYKVKSDEDENTAQESKTFELGVKEAEGDEIRYIEYLQPGDPEDYIGKERFDKKYKELTELVKASKEGRLLMKHEFKITLIVEYGELTMNVIDQHVPFSQKQFGFNEEIELLIYDKNRGLFSYDEWKVLYSSSSGFLKEGE
ncbi:MAG: hypothetical protein HWE22_13925 [Flavobacteriales bacterium]|nr:hypothetical protein [Flavobacteriales bacterium]